MIGLNGLKGSGKDTAYEYLNKKYGVKRLSFADKLKESASRLFNIEPILWDHWKNDPNVTVEILSHGKKISRFKPISAREFLQRYGTEAHRDVFGDDFWVEQAFSGDIDIFSNVYAITDCRFENEINKIRELGGAIVRIDRGLAASDNHASEWIPPVSLIDYVVDNKGSLEEFYENLDEMYSWYINDFLYYRTEQLTNI